MLAVSNEEDEVQNNQCLRDLLITDPYFDMLRIEDSKDTLLKDCYSWIPDDPQFLTWRAREDCRLLWIKGDPGKGKTMLVVGLVNELFKITEEILIVLCHTSSVRALTTDSIMQYLCLEASFSG